MTPIYLWNLGSREPDRLLTQDDVTRAHIAAPHVLTTWQTHDAHYWRRASLGFLIGTAAPIFGYFALQWTVGTMLLALFLDVLVLWICDGLKLFLAEHRVQQELAHLHEAAELRMVIRALRRPRRPRYRDLFAEAPKPALYLTPLDPGTGLWLLRWVGVLASIIVVSLLVWVFLRFDASVVPLLLAGILIRIAWSTATTIRARDDAASRPELLPEAAVPTMALVALVALVALLFNIDLAPALKLDRHMFFGGVILLLHFLIAALLSWLGLSHVRDLIASLRAFVASDREQLRQRVRHYNGEESS